MNKRRVTTTDGHTMVCLSRWISIQAITVTERHALSQYADDGIVLCFRWQGRRYALGQFMRYGGPWGPPVPPMWEEADGLHHIAGYDQDDYYNPIQIELDDCCEAVRIWQEVPTW